MGVTKFLRYDDEEPAQTYVTTINEYSQEQWSEQFAAEWYPRQDIDGKWCSPYFGPPAENAGGAVEEPEEFVVLREGAEMVDTLLWPEEC